MGRTLYVWHSRKRVARRRRMAEDAIWIKEDGTRVRVVAKKLVASDGGKNFCCSTLNCKARMYGYALGSNNARFNSYNINDHISAKCIGREMRFNPHNYAEELFSLENIVADLENEDNHRGNYQGYKPHSGAEGSIDIDNQSKTSLRTTGGLYTMCSNIGVDGTYNGISINDFFACRDNYAEKSRGFTGLHVVEASFYKYENKTPNMIFNYTPYNVVTNEPVHLRVIFGDSKTMFKFFERHFRDNKTGKVKQGARRRLVVIMGVWHKCDDDCIAECRITKLSQFKFIE